jgi:hypothetical protein
MCDLACGSGPAQRSHPNAQFSLKVGASFEDSALGLEKWLPALWLPTDCKIGISSYELGRALGVTEKTAWFMLYRLRLALRTEDDGKLGGQVEADETYIGGKGPFHARCAVQDTEQNLQPQHCWKERCHGAARPPRERLSAAGSHADPDQHSEGPSARRCSPARFFCRERL